MNKLLNFISSNNIQKIAILCDEKVWQLYPDYFHFLDEAAEVHYISIEASEKNKDIESIIFGWNFLLEQKFDRNSLLISWGGGIISDIGGMIAATFKRGIRLVNVPTTFLAMIDAAHGGKNGINLHHQKNVIGTFYLPEDVIIDIAFLKTLPKKELLNGFAELIKYALIGNKKLWEELQYVTKINYKIIKNEWIDEAIQFKTKLITEDLHDKGIRQVLNFGHTVGHAIERLFAEKKRAMSHGYAVAIGMCYELRFSHEKGFIASKDVEAIQQYILRFYKPVKLSESDVTAIANYCFDDKKNKNGHPNFIFLEEIGKAIPNSLFLQSFIETLRATSLQII
ncbi:MAG: 3-dehydroquinate synthase [Bacteroidetes bacterium]|nr:3-dehydroquinate synthase [Bacteroidota bacterium]MCL2303061.1 3-dehydroquinate synthase [Lentimicrobiaceae bacterium]